MDVHVAQIIALSIYKLTSLLIGLALCYMGYRLFMAGIWGNAGDASGEFGNNKIVVKRAAPGTFFILMGAIVLGLTIFMGLNLEKIEPPCELLNEKPQLTE